MKNVLIQPIKARYFRLIPTEWQHTISLRMELYGCLGTVLFHVLGKGACMTKKAYEADKKEA